MAYVVNITAILSAEHVLHSAVFFLLMIVYIYLIHQDTTVKAVSSLSIFLTDNYIFRCAWCHHVRRKWKPTRIRSNRTKSDNRRCVQLYRIMSFEPAKINQRSIFTHFNLEIPINAERLKGTDICFTLNQDLCFFF